MKRPRCLLDIETVLRSEVTSGCDIRVKTILFHHVALLTNDHLANFPADDEAAASDARCASYHKAVGLE
jgi:hypothetical protein